MKTDNTWAIYHEDKRGNVNPVFTGDLRGNSRSLLIVLFVKWVRDYPIGHIPPKITWRQLKRRGYSCEKIHIKRGWVE